MSACIFKYTIFPRLYTCIAPTSTKKFATPNVKLICSKLGHEINSKLVKDMTSREQRVFRELQRIAVKINHFTYEQLKYCVGSLIPNLPIITTAELDILRPSEGGWLRDKRILHRGRVNEIKQQGSTCLFPWQTIDKISHIPLAEKHNVKDWGRCNKPEEIRFYCSNYYPTCCNEVASEGFTKSIIAEHVTVGDWLINEPLNLAVVNFSLKKLNEIAESTKYKPTHLYEKHNTWIAFCEERFKNSNNSYSVEFNIEVLNFFSDHFGTIDIKSENDYYFSNLYCDVIFNHSFADENGLLYDGVKYPSVKNSYQEYNIVLHPRAMQKLQCIGASNVWVTYHANADVSKINFNPLETASLDEAGNILWNIFKAK
jgi:hypothetical protein